MSSLFLGLILYSFFHTNFVNVDATAVNAAAVVIVVVINTYLKLNKLEFLNGPLCDCLAHFNFK